MTEFSQRVITIIKSIPEGRAASYGQIAAAAGNPRASRQVARLLHSCSDKYDLPWHRIIGSSGRISIRGPHALLQRQMLEEEGVEFGLNGKIALKYFGIVDG